MAFIKGRNRVETMLFSYALVYSDEHFILVALDTWYRNINKETPKNSRENQFKIELTEIDI